jgi:hypothetical protein
MGDLVHLSDIIGESGEPSERAALAHVSSALAQVETEIANVLSGQDTLQSEMAKASDVKRDLAERIVGEATSLVEMMKSGAAWALARCGSRGTVKAAELLSVSSIQTAIGEATLEEAAEEIKRLEAKRERLLVARASIAKEVVREAIERALLDEWAETLMQLRAGLTRLTALRRFLEPQSHDFRPDANRLAVIVPDFASGSGDTAVVATAAAIGRMEAILAQFAADLERDPRAPVPELEVDMSPDADEVYSNLSAPERAARDREAVFVTQHRRTVDAELFAEQVREAAAFRALTN